MDYSARLKAAPLTMQALLASWALFCTIVLALITPGYTSPRLMDPTRDFYLDLIRRSNFGLPGLRMVNGSVTFTSERRGNGQADVYRVAINGSEVTSGSPEPLAVSDGVDDSGEISPDGKMLAFSTSRYNHTSNIMLMDLETGDLKNLTLANGIAGAANPTLPNGYFKPTWSPDSEWVVFTSDRNTPWRGHSAGAGWEHTQELSIYAARPNGDDFRLVSSRSNYTQGSPQFSPDGKRLVFYEMQTEDTYNGRLQPELLYGSSLNSSIVSVDFPSGKGRTIHATGPGVKISPRFVTKDVSFLRPIG